MPQIEVKFSIDANGILHVTAKDKGTGKEQTIQIQGSSGLDENEINKMREDAEAHAEDDKKRRELVDTKNQGDSQAYQMEKQLKDLGEKISAEDRSNVESAISALKDTLKNDDVDAIKAAMETLNGASHKIAEAMYAQASDEGTTDQPTGDVGAPDDKGDDDGDVIDAEYEVKE